MPNTGSLALLCARLQEQTAPRNIFPATTWGNPRAMTEVLKEIRRELGNETIEDFSDDRVKAALLHFTKTGKVDNFVQLKYLCHGLLLSVNSQSAALIDRESLFDGVLSAVNRRQDQAKQFRRCYQGLLGAYFAVHVQTTEEGVRMQNWRTLRSFLLTYLPRILATAKRRGVAPEWLETLSEHKNLLGEFPCKRYAAGLVRGDTSTLKSVCAGLGISAASWVWTDALVAYVDHVCEYTDRPFHAALAEVLKLVNGRAELKLPGHLADHAIAKVVVRYAACADKPEHGELRDACLQRIGNPWLDRTAWDAHVRHEPARQMVEAWVKRRLIRDFFELLAHDGSADVRRLNYWLKWEPHITDMWFVLGSDAQKNKTAAFDSVRKRMAGSGRKLADSNEQNNAFVMRIGPLLAIEFGMTGNACYIFAASEFKSDLNQQWLDTKRDLKQRNCRIRLPHLGQWEAKFDLALRDLLRNVPAFKGDLKFGRVLPDSVAPAPQAAGQASSKRIPGRALSSVALSGGPLLEADFAFLTAQCMELGIDCYDHRHNQGAFWVLMHDRNADKELAALLEKLGFHFAANGKGYWYKSK